MSKLELIELIALIVVCLALVVYYVIMAIKNKWVNKLMKCIEDAIKEAEKSGLSGEEKKNYVLKKVKEKCDELEIPYNLIYKLISKLIDTIIKHYNILAKSDTKEKKSAK